MDNLNRRNDGMNLGDDQPGQANLAMMQNPGAEQAQRVQYVCGCKSKNALILNKFRMWIEK